MDREVSKDEMKRVFETGASRDTDDGKFDYEGFISPLVLESFAAYMHKNRRMRDGSLRDSDNWQKGIPQDQYMKSLLRHTHDAWMIHRGFPARDGVDIIEAFNGVLFNAMGYMFEVLTESLGPDERFTPAFEIGPDVEDLAGGACPDYNAVGDVAQPMMDSERFMDQKTMNQSALEEEEKQKRAELNYEFARLMRGKTDEQLIDVIARSSALKTEVGHDIFDLARAELNRRGIAVEVLYRAGQ